MNNINNNGDISFDTELDDSNDNDEEIETTIETDGLDGENQEEEEEKGEEGLFSQNLLAKNIIVICCN